MREPGAAAAIIAAAPRNFRRFMRFDSLPMFFRRHQYPIPGPFGKSKNPSRGAAATAEEWVICAIKKFGMLAAA
jgi:hypothetical protein